MSQSQTSNDPDLDIKEDLYMLYLELKEELTSKNIELSKDQIAEAVNTININTIVEYIREMVYILINTKFPKKEETINQKRTKDEKDKDIYQMESQIRKLECDIKFLIQKEFQNKIKRDTLEMKVNSYMEMENEFEELKEKVKYQGGEFLNNERKDNEIIILRQENGILKKEIEKHEINNKKYESKIKSEQETIQDLTSQISLLNEKVSKLELLTTQKQNNIPQTNNNSSSINININNNGNSSSKWIIKQENQDSNTNIKEEEDNIINTKEEKLDMIGESEEDSDKLLQDKIVHKYSKEDELINVKDEYEGIKCPPNEKYTYDPYLESNIINRFFFYWSFTILRMASKYRLSSSDLGKPSNSNDSRYFAQKLHHIWNVLDYKSIQNHALFKTVVRSNACSLLIVMLLSAIQAGLDYFSVIITK